MVYYLLYTHDIHLTHTYKAIAIYILASYDPTYDVNQSSNSKRLVSRNKR